LRKEKVDTKDLQIVTYLYEKGPTSASDEGLQKAIGMSRIGLSDRIKTLQTKVFLKESKVPIGNTFKEVYSVIDFNF
jgi:DNA-binding Lrp family transcriptional regulator